MEYLAANAMKLVRRLGCAYPELSHKTVSRGVYFAQQVLMLLVPVEYD
jgi:hypothetical protein